MRKLTTYYFLFLLVLFYTSLAAQAPHIVVERIPFEEGKQGISDFYQDTTGLIWLFGQSKWYISDGEKIIETPIPLVSDSTRYLYGRYKDFSGKYLYLGGDSVRIFNPYTRRIIQSIGIDKSYEAGNKTGCFQKIVASSDSIIWAILTPSCNIGTKDDFAIVQSRNGMPFKQIDFVINNTLKSPYIPTLTVRGNHLFIPILDTILQYNIDGQLVKAHAFPPTSKIPGTLNQQVDIESNVKYLHYSQKTYPDNRERTLLYLKPNDSVFEFDHITLPDIPELHLLRLMARGDDFWIYGPRMSLHRFIPEEETVIDYSKYILQQHPELRYFTDYVLTVFKDKTGTLWVATVVNGVFKISSKTEPFKRYLSEKRAYSFCAYSSCVIRGIVSDELGNIYFGYDYGIKKIDHKTRKLSELNLNLSEELKAVYSLTYYNQKLYMDAKEIDPITGNVNSIISGKEGNRLSHLIDEKNNQMWIADGGGILRYNEPLILYRYDFETKDLKEIAKFKMPYKRGHLDQASQMHLSPTTNTLFIATLAQGVYEIEPDGTIIHHLFKTEQSDTIRRTLALYEDTNQQLWIGHATGISKLDLKTKEFTKVPYKMAGSLSRHVFSIQAQNETFCWLGTSGGLYRLNVETGELQNFEMIRQQKHIEFNRTSTYQSSDGTMYFGSVEGLFIFHPDDFVREAEQQKQHRIQISRVSLFDLKKDTIINIYHDLIDKTTFHTYPNHQYISFDVFVPDFREAKKHTYTWWLEGYDSGWSKPTTSNKIRYDNLLPGDYTLHIRGGINSYYYENSEKQFKIIVHKAWYKTGWAYSVYLGLCWGLIYLIYRYKINQKLERAEAKRLKELDVLKTRLYTNITHEFRTPLTVIMGMTDNIRGHQNEKKLISRNSKNLLRLVNQLLDLSKLDSGRMEMDTIQADIINYLQYLTESFYSMAEEKKVRLMFYSEIKDLVMDFDEVKIQHIIYNLLSNAIKFSQSGDKVILHTTETERNGLPHLKLKVTDTGIGINEKDLNSIFDRFYQADSTSTRKVEGTGIGLALTKELVEIMGGKISVNSQLGEGTEFLIVLPITRNADTPITETVLSKSRQLEQELIPEIREDQTKTIPSLKEKPQLLIIEDNKDVTTYMSNLLKFNYQITTAKNGKIGVQMAVESIPDIIISDVMMPEMDGYEVCQALKNDERTSHIPIILLTAKANTNDRVEGLSEGADAYLTKPFNKKELFVRLEQLIMLRKSLQKRYASFQNMVSKEPTIEEVFLQKLIQTVENRMDDPNFGVTDLCHAANLSNMQVNRKLKALTGKTPSRFIRSIRFQKAIELLNSTDLNISEIAYEVGFSDPNYFSRSFSEEFGYPPNVIRS